MNVAPISWAVKATEGYGNALGYGTHSINLLREIEKIMEVRDDAHIAVHLTPAERFKYIKGKFNILFTMWEFLELPNVYIASLNRADAIIVPCSFNKELFRKYTDRPIFVCREGVISEDYPYYERNLHDGKFRFLWSGAPNQRKGYPFVIEATKVFENFHNVEIYIKTTSKNLSRESMIEAAQEIKDKDYQKERLEVIDRIVERIPKMEQYASSLNRFGKHQNIIFDTRKLTIQELRDLYNSAHCFIMPSFGEGWGLTLCEAMATGCPAIAPPITGIKDYFDNDVGYEINYGMVTLDIRQNYGIKTLSFVPNINDFIDKMFLVMSNYGQALKKGKRASDRIHSKFTWKTSAARFKEIITQIEAEYVDKSRKLATVS